MTAYGVLVKPASGLCNMHCDYCFYCDEQARRKTAFYGMMRETTLKNVIKRTLMRSEGAYTLAFQGGEPTLRGIPFFRKAVDICSHYNKNHCRLQFAFQTNGYAIDEEWAAFFHDNQFLVGLSVDGTGELHDRHRHAADGGSSFTHVLRAAELFDRFGVDYNILTVVHKETAAHIGEIYAFYKEMGWNYQQYITCLDPLESARQQDGMDQQHSPYSLTAEDYGTFLCRLFDLWYADYLSGKQPYIRQFENYIGILMGIEPESCEQRGTCSRQLVVEADGSVYPCDFYALDEWKLGNFNSDLLPDIERRRDESGFIQKSLHLDEKCLSCEYLQLCRCGCRRSRTVTAEPAMLNIYCEGYRKFFAYAQERLKRCAMDNARRQ